MTHRVDRLGDPVYPGEWTVSAAIVRGAPGRDRFGDSERSGTSVGGAGMRSYAVDMFDEQREDTADVEAVDAAWAETLRRGEKPVPWELIRAELAREDVTPR
jgi:hypothetical protein